MPPVTPYDRWGGLGGQIIPNLCNAYYPQYRSKYSAIERTLGWLE